MRFFFIVRLHRMRLGYGLEVFYFFQEYFWVDLLCLRPQNLINKLSASLYALLIMLLFVNSKYMTSGVFLVASNPEKYREDSKSF